jgi:hypothetical protein
VRFIPPEARYFIRNFSADIRSNAGLAVVRWAGASARCNLRRFSVVFAGSVVWMLREGFAPFLLRTEEKSQQPHPCNSGKSAALNPCATLIVALSVSRKKKSKAPPLQRAQRWGTRPENHSFHRRNRACYRRRRVLDFNPLRPSRDYRSTQMVVMP